MDKSFNFTGQNCRSTYVSCRIVICRRVTVEIDCGYDLSWLELIETAHTETRCAKWRGWCSISRCSRAMSVTGCVQVSRDVRAIVATAVLLPLGERSLLGERCQDPIMEPHESVGESVEDRVGRGRRPHIGTRWSRRSADRDNPSYFEASEVRNRRVITEDSLGKRKGKPVQGGVG